MNKMLELLLATVDNIAEARVKDQTCGVDRLARHEGEFAAGQRAGVRWNRARAFSTQHR